MTTSVVSETDLVHLGVLLDELHSAGRVAEAAAVARVYSVVQGMLIAELEGDLDDDAPEFVRMMEAAEADIATNRLIPHEDVVRHLQALGDA